MKNKFVVFLFLLISVQCFAQDVDLEKIVVTPSRIEQELGDSPRRVDIITAKDMEQAQSRDLGEAMDDISAIDIISYGGQGSSKSIRMRGSTSSQVLVLIDGRPINNPRDGSVDLSQIPLENIDKVEIMHGPASNLYGAGAMGGTVNILTKKPPKHGQKTTFTSSFATFRTYAERLTHGARIANFGYLVNADYESSLGSRGNSRSNTRDFNTKFEYKLNENNDLSLGAGFYKSNSGAPGPASASDIDDKQRSLKNFLDFNWSFKPDDLTAVLAKIYNNYDRLEFNENSADSIYDTGAGKFIHSTQARGLDLQFNRQWSEYYQLMCGFNYVLNYNDSTSSAKHHYIVRAWYLDNKFDFFKDLKINLGVRIDDYSNFGAQASPSLNAVYKLNDHYSFHGLISRSFRAPTFNDLYWPDDGYTRGNPDLKPEKGTTFEGGIQTKLNKNILLDLTYYRNNYNELINWMPNAANVWMPTNIGSAVINGVELTNNLYIMNNLECELGYTFLYAKNDKSKKFLIYQPENKVNLALKYKTINGFAIDAKGEFTDMRYHNAENTIKVKRFYLLGLDVSKKFKQGVTYYVAITNMLAKKYQVVRDYPMPGFSITNAIKYEF